MDHAHNLPEFLHFLEEIDILRGFVFGFTHTLIPLIGFYSGWSINRLLKIVSNGYVAGILGVVWGGFVAQPPLNFTPTYSRFASRSNPPCSKYHLKASTLYVMLYVV